MVGTGTIDLYKPTKLEMKRWGVRNVDIDILQWGSEEQSLKVLGPRAKHQTVRRMIAGLQKKGPVFTRWGCFYFRAVFGSALSRSHFGLINSSGRRFSRE